MEPGGTIDEEECWQLLSKGTIGRLALSVDALPGILPVYYAVDDRVITLSLGELRVPDRCADGAVVAFAVDELDLDNGCGWYVHTVGKSVVQVRDEPTDGWNGGVPGQIVRVAPAIVDGRRFRLPPPTSRG